MKNLNHKVCSVVFVAYFAMFILNSFSYAVTTSKDIYVECTEKRPSPWVVWEGDPKSQYTLTSRGVVVPKNKLIVDWDDYSMEILDSNPIMGAATPDALAVCGESYDHVNWVSMLTMLKDDISDVSPLTCPKGQSISITFSEPKCKCGKYMYAGTLIKVTDDDEEDNLTFMNEISSNSSLGSSESSKNHMNIEKKSISGKGINPKRKNVALCS